MTGLSSFLPHNTITRHHAVKSSSAKSMLILFPAHAKVQVHFTGSRLAHPKLQVARAAVICIAQVEEAAQDGPSPSLNGAGLQMDRPVPVESVRQDGTDEASASSAHAAAGSREDARNVQERPPRRDSFRGGRGRDSRGRRGGWPGDRPDDRTGDKKEFRAHHPPRNNDPRKAPCTEHSLKVGDVVLGRVIRSVGKGSNVELLDDPRIIGFSLAVDGPYLMRDRVGFDQANMLMPIGLVRQFSVKAIPQQMEYYGKGPLLSAKELDIEVAWSRARQMMHTVNEDKEILTVTVTDVNSGGLLATLESLPAFLPYSLMQKSQEDSWMSIEDMRAKYLGKVIEVGIKDVTPEMRKVVLDMRQAIRHRLLRKLQVGALLWGTVRRVEAYGVFVSLEETAWSGLLHISCISKAHVESVEDIFSVGDRVRVLLVGMDDGFQRISLSTAELEATPGDMLFLKDKVFEEAEVNAAEAIKRMQQQAEDERFYGNDKAPAPARQGGGGGDSFDFDGDYQA